MKLLVGSIKKLINGACFFKEDKGYLYPYHYSEKQLDHFKERDQFWYTRAKLQTGIKIEFITDAKEISLYYNTPEVYSGDNSIDLYVDDLAMGIHHITRGGKGIANFTLHDGEKKVTLYLPIDVPIGIKCLTVNGKWKSVRARNKKLLAIGDSITQGYGAKISGSSYINSLYRKTDYEMLVQGIGGYRYEKGSVMPIEGFVPDKILVALGTNYHDDLSYDYEKNIEEFYSALNRAYGDIPVISVTPIYRFDPGYNPERLNAVCKKIKAECAKYPNISVIDGWHLVPHIQECFTDCIHPNAYGSELMAQGIFEHMKKIKF
ncbi:MAG: hypothetical protein IJX51_08225 [Clostridia bacterium]|nr:hypothetical protein [Clostridia bacterium]